MIPQAESGDLPVVLYISWFSGGVQGVFKNFPEFFRLTKSCFRRAHFTPARAALPIAFEFGAEPHRWGRCGKWCGPSQAGMEVYFCARLPAEN